jgi:hypothetical protein
MISNLVFTDGFSFPRAPESRVAYYWARWILPQIADFINLEGGNRKATNPLK